MGVMRFLIYPQKLVENWPEAERTYLSGFDGRVFSGSAEIVDGMLIYRRQSSESGKLHVAWPVPEYGLMTLATSSLNEREQPYLLPVELARGKLSMLKDQWSAWNLAGMAIPDEFYELEQDAFRLFAKAATIQEQPDAAAALAMECLVKTCKASDILTEAYADQRLRVRRQRTSQMPALLGCRLQPEDLGEATGDLFGDAFTAANIPVEWSRIEDEEGEYFWDDCDYLVDWCEENHLHMCGGPLLDFSPEGMPGWIHEWKHDLLNLQSFINEFVETAITRYMGQIRQWEVAARVNTGGILDLDEETRLTLIARTLETARSVDQESQLLIRVDQPWGNYQRRGGHRLSPLQFVDALVRSGIGLSGVNLEIENGYFPNGSGYRGLLEFSRLIDQWGQLGVPLYVTLAHPSQASGQGVEPYQLSVDPGSNSPLWTEEHQTAWIDKYLPMLMAKQSVAGIYWSHFCDDESDRFPGAGLVSEHGTPKPALQKFIDYRQDNWQQVSTDETDDEIVL